MLRTACDAASLPDLPQIACDAAAIRTRSAQLAAVRDHRPVTLDDDLVRAYAHARGEDRFVLLQALGATDGDAGTALLMREAAAQGRGAADVRSVALEALGQRADGAATGVYVRALADTSVQVQISAALCLALHGDGSATAPFLSWMDSKLKRKRRLANWDPREVPAPLLHAVRNGAVDTWTTVLIRHLDALAAEEEAWLTRLGVTPNGVTDALDEELVREWLFEYVISAPVEPTQVRTLVERLSSQGS
jgi:hypothetical protein